MTWREQIKYIRENWRSLERRPIWQIAILLPLYPVYLIAREFADWMDQI